MIDKTLINIYLWVRAHVNIEKLVLNVFNYTLIITNQIRGDATFPVFLFR